MATFKIRNVMPGMVSLNLDTPHATLKGKPASLILAAGEVSRDLTPAEFESFEIQKLIGRKLLLDVTAFAERQLQAKAAQGR